MHSEFQTKKDILKLHTSSSNTYMAIYIKKHKNDHLNTRICRVYYKWYVFACVWHKRRALINSEPCNL